MILNTCQSATTARDTVDSERGGAEGNYFSENKPQHNEQGISRWMRNTQCATGKAKFSSITTWYSGECCFQVNAQNDQPEKERYRIGSLSLFIEIMTNIQFHEAFVFVLIFNVFASTISIMFCHCAVSFHNAVAATRI
jgi:hypothetical protein